MAFSSTGVPTDGSLSAGWKKRPPGSTIKMPNMNWRTALNGADSSLFDKSRKHGRRFGRNPFLELLPRRRSLVRDSKNLGLVHK